MKGKGYDFSDSCTAMVSSWEDGISTEKRCINPKGDPVLSRMCGNSIHGVLFRRVKIFLMIHFF